ncbi:MAG: hypothetical protein ACTHLH_09000 [Solirubrobacterales bacterium]
MGAHEELRAALHKRKVEKGDESAQQKALDLQRKQYEDEEEATRQLLHEMATITLQALLRESKPERIPLNASKPTKRRLIRPGAKHVYGWRVALGNSEREVLCTDGRLVTWNRVSGEPRFLTLHAWIDQRIRNARIGDLEGGGTRFDQAFSLHAWRHESHQAELRLDLRRAQTSMTDHLAEILRERNVSV